MNGTVKPSIVRCRELPRLHAIHPLSALVQSLRAGELAQVSVVPEAPAVCTLRQVVEGRLRPLPGSGRAFPVDPATGHFLGAGKAGPPHHEEATRRRGSGIFGAEPAAKTARPRTPPRAPGPVRDCANTSAHWALHLAGIRRESGEAEARGQNKRTQRTPCGCRQS